MPAATGLNRMDGIRGGKGRQLGAMPLQEGCDEYTGSAKKESGSRKSPILQSSQRICRLDTLPPLKSANHVNIVHYSLLKEIL